MCSCSSAPSLCTFSGGGSPMCRYCSTLLALHSLGRGAHMHAQFSGCVQSPVEPEGSTLMCALWCSAFFAGGVPPGGVVGWMHYSSPLDQSTWTELPPTIKAQGKRTMVLTGSSGPVVFPPSLCGFSLVCCAEAVQLALGCL